MGKEIWEVLKDDIITPEMLENDTEKYGGRSSIVHLSIKYEVTTIPIKNGCSRCSIRVCNKELINRIIKDGFVDIYSEGYWAYVGSPKISICFHNTTEKIPHIV